MALVSVLLPNYNNAPYLKECLESLFNQTFQDFIIYFVDDRSTDNSLEVARSFDDPRLIIVEKEQNSGIVDTMNVALDLIETKYYIRMDGDDISTPDRFQLLVDFMESNPEYGVCSSSIESFGTVSEVLKFESNPEFNKANLIFGHSVGHASSIFRTSVMKDNGIRYIDRFWRMEDYDLFYRMKDLALMTSIPNVLYLYRRGEYNLNEEIWNKKKLVRKKFYEMVLSDLNIEPNDSNIDVHMELARKAEAKNSLKVYKKHIENLIAANSKTGIYPPEELKVVLERQRVKLLFGLIDSGKINVFQLIPHFFSTKGLLKYYIKKTLKFK